MRENMIYNPRYYQLREYQVKRVLDIINNNKLAKENGVVFFGDSITEQLDIEKYFPMFPIKYNCGVSGFTSENLLWIIDEAVIKYKPSNVVLMIGTNDLGHTTMSSPREIAINIKEIIEILKLNLVDVKITLISPLPCDENLHGSKLGRGFRTNEALASIYTEVKALISHFKDVELVNIFPYLLDNDSNNINSTYTYDGLHLSEAGYNIYVEKLLQLSTFLNS